MGTSLIFLLCILLVQVCSAATFWLAFRLAQGQPVIPKVDRPKLRKPVPPTLPAQPVKSGVDEDAERTKIVQKAKSDFNMTDAQASAFADEVISKAQPLLGRLQR